jgi:glucose/arabinose dehydrogenase
MAIRITVVAIGLAVLLASIACGGKDSSSVSGAQVEILPAVVTPVVVADEPAPTTPLPTLHTERAFGSQTFAEATGLYELPDGRFVVLEKAGRMLLVSRDGAKRDVLLDLTSKVRSSELEEGLLGFAAAPDFATSGVFYLDYIAKDPHSTVISRFVFKDGRVDPKSEEALIKLKQEGPYHKSGQLLFGADGYLYISVGDGIVSRGDPGKEGKAAAQHLDGLYGKILRIDVSGKEGDKAYRVPADNPFVGQKDIEPEIWAYGFRNPWRFSIDPVTGRLWAADVGASMHEEVDLVQKAKNYGWNTMEGFECYIEVNCDSSGLEPPLFSYDSKAGRCAIVGGFVYRGQEIAALRGAYVYADYCSGEISALRYDGQRVTQQSLLAQIDASISSLAADLNGDLYVIGYGAEGEIYKLVP